MNKKPLQLKDYLLISFICVLFGVCRRHVYGCSGAVRAGDSGL